MLLALADAQQSVLAPAPSVEAAIAADGHAMPLACSHINHSIQHRSRRSQLACHRVVSQLTVLVRSPSVEVAARHQGEAVPCTRSHLPNHREIDVHGQRALSGRLSTSQLAAAVVAPCVQSIVFAMRQAVTLAPGHAGHIAGEIAHSRAPLNGSRLLRISISQLTTTIVAPSEEGAVATDSQAVHVASGHLCNCPPVDDHMFRSQDGIVGGIAELAALVGPPSVEHAALADDEAVPPPRSQGDDRFAQRDLKGPGPWQVGAIPQLAIPVPAPSEEGAVLGKGKAVPPADSNAGGIF
mmetsp:Transcript_85524/g.190048  ORF Transcript_85524/g.190048 Transcript_85524/m.190048 type:complete len:296 (-) Transcript_85524:340-1227(-)